MPKGFFYIECKVKLQCLNNFMEIQMGGGLFKLGILRGGGLKQFWKFRWEGGKKTMPSIVGVWIFSGITR